MEAATAVVLDANIALRAVLGAGARRIIAEHAGPTWMCAPAVAFADARRHLPVIAGRRGWSPDALKAALDALDALEHLVHPIDAETYHGALGEAHLRIDVRDPDDAPILATALTLACPVWTEDQDFFGTGVPTWTTDRVELYLSPDRPATTA
ncbi:nucleotide-binding protein [Xylanimonas allomyrinae]|uniref:Nucleotide-binding protein n=1 Tax=Xylanimonas allomyrinae TaxID=2509459 RepID=A0A4P6EPE4_9MICO|nr:PIN domain-containing protein [Xylanimonas allomyrinae]QAY63239.1 nucleotide-binding protein [Xylanimonas allomyrinae]